MTISTLKPPNHQVILKNISWKTYEALLADMGEKSRIQLTYDQGILEIRAPLDPHETYTEILGRMVTTITEELKLEVRSLGSRTCKREDLYQGLEPDKCFYIKNEAVVRDVDQIDLNQYPPPDLVIEIDITSRSINRLKLYARLGVPEVWQYDEKQLKIYYLTEQTYQVCDVSPTFPQISATKILRFLAMRKTLGENGLIRQFRQWLREQISG